MSDPCCSTQDQAQPCRSRNRSGVRRESPCGCIPAVSGSPWGQQFHMKIGGDASLMPIRIGKESINVLGYQALASARHTNHVGIDLEPLQNLDNLGELFREVLRQYRCCAPVAVKLKLFPHIGRKDSVN